MIPNKDAPVNPFPPSLVRALTDAIEAAARTATGPLYAAFDADGTLWDTDVGEAFFDYQIRCCGLEGLPSDPWRRYRDLKKTDPAAAYAWLAQINRGRTLAEVRAWAKDCVERQAPFPVFESQRELIGLLRRHGFEIFVVTASVKWAVEPAAALLGINPARVLGVTTEVVNGVVTDRATRPITWRQGKADALLAATRGVAPALCSGNTLGDIALLSAADRVRLAVSTQSAPGTGLFEEEERLREEAEAHGWLRHAFREPER